MIVPMVFPHSGESFDNLSPELRREQLYVLAARIDVGIYFT